MTMPPVKKLMNRNIRAAMKMITLAIVDIVMEKLPGELTGAGVGSDVVVGVVRDGADFGGYVGVDVVGMKVLFLVLMLSWW